VTAPPAPWRPWHGDPDDDPPDFQAELTLLSVGGLSLELSVRSQLYTLYLRAQGELLELGYDDDCAQFLPWTLRWTELDSIARLVALRDPRLPHPGPYLALLSRFTPLLTADEVAQARPMLASALAALREGPPPVPELKVGPTVDERLAYHLDHWDLRHDGRRRHRWRHEPVGWFLEIPGEPYGALSCRGDGESDFPHREWNAFMAGVEAEYDALVRAGGSRPVPDRPVPEA
jgi:hypothetical protein